MSIKDNYYIKKVSHKVALDMVIKNHYLHRVAPCSFSFGLFSKIDKNINTLFPTDKLVGVIIYGTPSSAPLRMGVCGIEEKDNVIELTRLWIEDNTPKNAESFLIGNTIPLVNKEIIVSFAEGNRGHLGIVYQATNWIYTGLSAKRTNWAIGGIDKHCQTIADKYTSKEIREIYGNDFKIVDRPRKHRYIYFNCNKYRKRELLYKLKYPMLPYPKTKLK